MTFKSNALNFPNLTTKSVPVGNDIVLLADSAASNTVKQTTINDILTNNPSAGGLTLIASVTASATPFISFTGNLSTTYDNYLILVEGLQPTSDSVTLLLQFGIAGSYYTTFTNYVSSANAVHSASRVLAAAPVYNTSSDGIGLSGNESGTLLAGLGAGINGTINMSNTNLNNPNTLYIPAALSTLTCPINDSVSGASYTIVTAGGWFVLAPGTFPMSDVRILFSAGNISGIAKLYGYQI